MTIAAVLCSSTAVSRYLDGSPFMVAWAKACKEGTAEACNIVSQVNGELRKQSASQLARIGSSYCRDVHPQAAIATVGLRAVRTEVQPWSKRDETSGFKKTAFDLGTYPIQSIAAAELYHAD
jgi:hypothetical protein